MRWIAIGQRAEGVVAIGQAATGVVAIGQLAEGVIAVGQLARGLVVVGQLGLGGIVVAQLGVGALGGVGLGVGTVAGPGFVVGLVGRYRHRRLSWVRPSGTLGTAVRGVLVTLVLAAFWWGVARPVAEAYGRPGGVFVESSPGLR